MKKSSESRIEDMGSHIILYQQLVIVTNMQSSFHSPNIQIFNPPSGYDHLDSLQHNRYEQKLVRPQPVIRLNIVTPLPNHAHPLMASFHPTLDISHAGG
jgi:hypothetical protein